MESTGGKTTVVGMGGRRQPACRRCRDRGLSNGRGNKKGSLAPPGYDLRLVLFHLNRAWLNHPDYTLMAKETASTWWNNICVDLLGIVTEKRQLVAIKQTWQRGAVRIDASLSGSELWQWGQRDSNQGEKHRENGSNDKLFHFSLPKLLVDVVKIP